MILIWFSFLVIFATFIGVMVGEYRFNKSIKAHDKRMRQMFSDIEETRKYSAKD